MSRALLSLQQDLRFGLRVLARGGVSTTVAVLILAIGIGATTAVFNVVYGVLLRPLDFPQPDRLVVVSESLEDGRLRNVSAPNFADIAREAHAFEHLSAAVARNFSLTGGDEPERVTGALVSSNWFDLLGWSTAHGRSFTAQEGEPGATQAVVLSHGLWQRRFGSEPGLVGRTLRIDDELFTVIGIMPADFQCPLDAELWVPLVLAPDDLAEEQRGEGRLNVFGRLAGGVSIEQARARLKTLAARLEQAHPQTNAGRTFLITPLLEAVVGDIRPALLTALAAVGLMLLLVCANVALLVTARYLGRLRELSLRVALGASHRRLLGQLLTESVLLSALGGALGLLVAWIGMRALVAASPPGLPRLDDLEMSFWGIGFLLLASFVTGAIISAMPALQLRRIQIRDVLQEAGTKASAGARSDRWRSFLAISEIALAVVLLIGASLLTRSFLGLLRVDPGFSTDRLMTLRLVMPSDSEPEEIVQLYDALRERLAGVPGVEKVGMATNVPLLSSRLSVELFIDGRPELAEDGPPEVFYETTDPDYFKTLGITILRGRSFGAQDVRRQPLAAIVNEAAARLYWPEGDALGQRISFDGPSGPWHTIVGIAGNVRRFDLSSEPPPQVYAPFLQDPWFFMTFVLRTSGEPARLAPAVRRAVWDVRPDQAIASLRTMEDLFAQSIALQRFTMLLVGVFAGVALVLTTAGLYGVIAYLVSQRRREISIRIALGADRRSVLWLVLLRGLTLAVVGVIFGIAAAFASTKLIANQLYGISATDLPTYVGVSLQVVLIAVLATLLPAWRAMATSPALVLRAEG